jgi:hopanoid biosynthesis associated protein HpnK
MVLSTLQRTELIINADDFGASDEVNEAIITAHREGILTSCSMMVTGDAFQQAVRLAKQNKGLAVGIHLVTVKGRSVLPPSQIPLLVDANGNFEDNPTIAGLKYFLQKNARRQLKQELAAQFARFVETGLRISHIDSHLHMHVHPVIFQAALELGRQYEVFRMRLPLDDFRLICRLYGHLSPSKAITASIFYLLCSRMKKRLNKEAFIFPVRVYGHLCSGEMTEEIVLSILDHLQSGINEIYFHPAIFAAGEVLDCEQLQCRKEFDILMSKKVRAKLAKLGCNPTSYSRLL